ncbi:MAG TPA: hypothetical protein VMB47_14730 [Candidatus Aquilonibacter sp.]|nr:hypothetical protein [Candidatus Aquilonibacter sp.]
MKRILPWALATCACGLLAASMSSPATAQTSSIEFVIQVTPTGGLPEPVRGFPVFLLSKSFEDIQKEADAAYPKESMNDFIDTLDVSKELKDWMKKSQWITFSGVDFIKKLTPDDVMDIPEFYKAYMDRNAGDQSSGFPIAKFKDSDKDKDPAKYQKEEDKYKEAVRRYVEQVPESINGIDMNLQDIDPSRKWNDLEAKRVPEVQRRITDLAQGKYLVARTETNLQGQGFFPNVPPGTYYLSTLDVPATVGDARPWWDVPLTVTPGQVSYAVLSNVNAVQEAANASP